MLKTAICGWSAHGSNRHITKTLLVMKLTVFLLTVAILNVSAKGLSQTVTLSGKNISLEKVFSEIKKQTGYFILHPRNVLDGTSKVDVQATAMPLVEFLELVFKDQPLKFSIGSKTINITRKVVSPGIAPPANPHFIVLYDAFPVRIRVTDDRGRPLTGASVLNRKTKQSGITDADGVISLNASVGDNIEISYVGFSSESITIKNNNGAVTVVLKLTEGKLEEIVVNKGYYTQSKLTNVGSVSTITAAEIAKQPVSTILEALVGRLNGLEIFPKSGIGGNAPNMIVRGQSGFGTIAAGNAANPPLFILDGVPLTQPMLISNGNAWRGDGGYLNNLLGLSPSDVESVSVLKDADATAIYGSRGSNGVILITTKRGSKANKVRVNVNASTGFQKVPHFIDMLSNEQYRAMRREAFANDKRTPTAATAPDLLVWDSTNVHDWQRELIGGTATFNDVSASVSGGNANTRFYVSSAYHEEGSVMPGNSKLTRTSFNASMNYLSDNRRFSVDVQSGYNFSDLNLLSTDMMAFIFNAPNYPVFDAAGNLDWSGSGSNPYASLRQKYSMPVKTYSGSIQVGFEILKGLKLKARAGYNTISTRMSWQQPLKSLNPAFNNFATLILQNSDNSNWIVEPFAEYARNFKDHHITVLAGGTFNRQNQTGMSLQAYRFPNDGMIADYAAADSFARPSTVTNPYAYSAFYARAGYDYKEKYLVNITFRRDGSTRFGPGNKFGNFGAIGVGWIFSSEEWAGRVLPFINFGKIRASYGTTGNDNIPSFQYVPYYTSSPSSAYNGTALLPQNIHNPNLKWEITRKFEAALELAVLNNRVSFTGAFFRNRVTDGLIYYVIAPQVPFNYFVSNYPSIVQNQGFEVELSTKNLKGAFTWNTNLNFTRTMGKLVAFDKLSTSAYSNTYVIGEPMTLIKTNLASGLDSTGLPSLGSTVPKDRVVSGNRNPFFGSMTNEFGYKGFNLSFLIQFSRQRGTPTYLPANYAGTNNFNTTTYVLDRWQKKGDELTTAIPRFTTSGSPNQYYGSTFWLSTAHIFRLSNVALSYTFSDKVIRRLAMSRLQVYCNAQNVFTFDKYRKYRLDPASGNAGMPPLRTFVFGINASF